MNPQNARLGVSKARLRTKTGCLTCRQRRKKCGEEKPECARCVNSAMKCEWPTAEQTAEDGRHHRGGSSVPKFGGNIDDEQATSEGAMDSQAESLPETETGSSSVSSLPGLEYLLEFYTPLELLPQPKTDSVLFAYFENVFLLSLVQKDCLPRFHDFSYMCAMALDYQPLMDVALACAALALSLEDSTEFESRSQLRQKGLLYRNSALLAMGEDVFSGNVDGTDDWLLAMHRNPESTPASSAAHIVAITQLFRTRERAKRQRRFGDLNEIATQDFSSLVFERLRYESLVFHGTVLTLYEKRFDLLTGIDTWDLLDEYFRETPLPTGEDRENWPVLGVPYRLFRLVVKSSRLSSRLPLSEQDLEMAKKMHAVLSRWKLVANLSSQSSVGTLYVLVAKALLQSVLSRYIQNSQQTDPLAEDVHTSVVFLAKVEIELSYNKYLLWPLSTLKAIGVKEVDKEVVEQKFSEISEKWETHGGWFVRDPHRTSTTP